MEYRRFFITSAIQETDGRNAYLLYDKNDRRIREKHLLPKEEEDYRQTMLCYDIRGRLTNKDRSLL